MKKVWERLSAEPALMSGAVMAVINLLALFEVLTMTADQLAGVNAALVAVLAVVIRATVSPSHGVPFEMHVGSRSKRVA